VKRLVSAGLFCAAVYQHAYAQTAAAPFSPDDIARGRKLYESHCSLCHGQTGTGGKGPNLAQPVLHHAADDETLAEVITMGIRGTEMPGTGVSLSVREVFQLSGYVRSLGRIEQVKLPGDPDRGRVLYESKGGCAACHIVRGAGSSLGPELTDIGVRRSAVYLRDALVTPGISLPEGFLVVSVTTRDGKVVRGIRVNEDSFSIQVRDSSNHFHSFRKSELISLRKEFNQTLMPGYESKFTAAELDDLIAYLASLRGES
jgi:cytochrome c oxidase cbb3-type subunit 3